jgi:hypothetical protein
LAKKSSRDPASPSWRDSNSVAAPGRFEEFLIPRAGNQLLRSRVGAKLPCIEIWRTKLSPAISRRRLTHAMCHHAKRSMFSSAFVARRGRFAPADKDGRAERPKRQICKTNSLKPREICSLLFQVQARTARSWLIRCESPIGAHG